MTKPLAQIEGPGIEFMLGPWRVQPARNAIYRGNEERHLENRLMQTLVFLASHQGRVISREQFFESVWHGRVVNEEALSRAISLLRSVLDDNTRAPKYIQTIPGVGYRLIAQVTGLERQGSTHSTSSMAHGNSIAVLPFVNLSGDVSNEYFSEGISEEILNVLAQIEKFKVVGRTSSFVFKNRNEDLRVIGKTLNVTHVLEGSVRKAGARVRITAQLIKTDDGYHLWSETFDRELDDIFAVQDDIASSVVQALKGKLLGEGAERPIPGGTDNTKAYQAYLLGVHYRNRGALKETVQHASNAFQRAIELDPQYAKAYAALANNWIDKVWNGYVSQEEGVLKINAAATRAIELAPELADGYLALSLLKQIDYKDPRGALEAISTAITLNPGNARMQIEFARMNSHLGHREISTKAARRAVELDPVSVFANHILGHVLYFNRQYEDAIAAFRHTLQLDPHYPKPHYFISMSYYWLGDTESALQEIQQEPLRWMKLTASAVILHRLGRTAEAEENFAALVELGNDENNYNQQAAVHAQWGDKEKAIGCLDLAFSQGDPGLTQLLVDPFLDPIRNDPRFIEIVRKVGLPDS